MKNIAVIPARGGSKRIPRKNIRKFLGKPIISFSIECARLSGLFDKIIVSTDDAEIANVAIAAGAEVPFFRSNQTSNDTAGLTDVLVEVIQTFEKQNIVFENICCLLATSPLTQVNHLKQAYGKLIDYGYDSVFPIVQYSSPIMRSLKIDGDKVIMNWPEYQLSRSQDLPKAYHDSGSFYWIAVSALLNQKKLFCSNSGFIELSEDQVQDIDSEIDWRMAEIKFQLLYNAL